MALVLNTDGQCKASLWLHKWLRLFGGVNKCSSGLVRSIVAKLFVPCALSMKYAKLCHSSIDVNP